MKALDIAALAALSTDPDELRDLSGSRFTAVRAAVATNAATPDDVLEVLVADRHHRPRYGVAENLKPSAVDIAMRAPDSWVRAILARRHDLPADVQQRLLVDPEREVRGSVARSTRDEDVLRTLAHDHDSLVRSVLASLRLTPDDVIEALSRDADRTVRCSVVTSYRASEDQLQRLLRDKSSAVRDCVVHWYSRRADVLAALEDDPHPDISRYVAALRGGLAQHGVSNVVVRDATARHRHRSIASLTKL